MKRVIAPVLMITLLFAACGGGAAIEEQVEARRDALAAAERISFTAEVTADLGSEVFVSTLACTVTPEQVSMEVLSPELVAGVTASVAAGEGKTAIEYGAVQLIVGAPDAPGPFTALPLLCEALRAGHVIRAWREDGLVAAEFYAGDDYGLTVWFTESGLVPVHAELYGSADGHVLARCEIRDFES